MTMQGVREQQARAVAEALKQELSFALPVKDTMIARWAQKLYDKPPERKELAFQPHSEDNNNAALTSGPKEVLSGALADTEDLDFAEYLYCMVHGDFTLIPGTDIDHTSSYSQIRKNQEAFIQMLNRDKTFADVFLAVSGIEQLFKRDTNGVIKGTGYFYKLCYNAIDNLSLLCHSCNIQKSDKDTLEHYKKHERFGQPFLNAVEQAGGLHQGVMIDVVGGNPIAALELGGVKQNIYSGSTGFGKFIRDWSERIYKAEFEIFKEELGTKQILKQKVHEMNQLFLAGNRSKAQQLRKDLNQESNQKKGFISANHPLHEGDTDSNQSSSDSRKKTDQKNVQELIEAYRRKEKNIKKIGTQLKEKYPQESSDIQEFVSNILNELNNVDEQDIQAMRAEIQEKLKETSLPPWSEIKTLIRESVKTMKDKYQNEKQRADELQAQVTQLKAMLAGSGWVPTADIQKEVLENSATGSQYNPLKRTEEELRENTDKKANDDDNDNDNDNDEPSQGNNKKKKIKK